MHSRTPTIAAMCVLGLASLAWAGAAAARDDRHGDPPARAPGSQEVVNGFYQCSGTVYTDDQPPSVSTYSYLTATSGITSDFYPIGQSSNEVPADLAAMAEICESHLSQVLAQVPGICVIGPIQRRGGEFGNGASTSASIDFSCQGTRDQVIGVVGHFSRVSLTARLP